MADVFVAELLELLQPVRKVDCTSAVHKRLLCKYVFLSWMVCLLDATAGSTVDLPGRCIAWSLHTCFTSATLCFSHVLSPACPSPIVNNSGGPREAELDGSCAFHSKTHRTLHPSIRLFRNNNLTNCCPAGAGTSEATVILANNHPPPYADVWPSILDWLHSKRFPKLLLYWCRVERAAPLRHNPPEFETYDATEAPLTNVV